MNLTMRCHTNVWCTWIFVYLLSLLRTQRQKTGIEIQRKYALPFWCGSFNILIHTNTIRSPSFLSKRLTLLFISVPCSHRIYLYYIFYSYKGRKNIPNIIENNSISGLPDYVHMYTYYPLIITLLFNFPHVMFVFYFKEILKSIEICEFDTILEFS